MSNKVISPEILKARYGSAKALREDWNTYFEDMYKYGLPRKKNNFYEGLEIKGPNDFRLADTTFAEAVRDHANYIISGIMPIGQRWARFVPKDNDPTLKKVLDTYTEEFFSHLERSNFYIAVSEMAPEFVLGTGAMVMLPSEDINNPLNCVAVPIDKLFLEENGSVWRLFNQILIRDIESYWPKAKLSKEMKDALSNDVNAKTDLIEAYVYDVKGGKCKFFVVNDKFDYFVIDQEEHDNDPWITVRYHVNSGDVYGTSNATLALVYAKQLNTLRMGLSYAAYQSSNLPIFINDIFAQNRSVAQDKLRPGAVNMVSGGSMDDLGKMVTTVKTFDESVIPFVREYIMELQQKIHEILMTKPLGDIFDVPNRSATEMAIRDQHERQKLGIPQHRWSRELMEPSIVCAQRVFESKGVLSVNLLNNSDFKDRYYIDYISPIANLQDEMDVSNVLKLFQNIEILYGREVAVMMAMRDKKLPNYLEEKLHTKPGTVPGEAEMETLTDEITSRLSKEAQPDLATQSIEPLDVGNSL